MEVHIRPLGGLANRMRVLASVRALAERGQAELFVHWECNDALNCSFNKLFCELNGIKLIEYSYIPSWRRFKRKTRQLNWRRLANDAEIHWDDEAILKLKERKSDVMKLAAGLSQLFIETCQHFYGDPTFIRFLTPIESIQKQLQERLKQLPQSYMGLHLRRGDNQRSIDISPLNLFFELLDKHFALDPQSQVYLATDDPKVAQQFKKRYDARLHYFDHIADRRKPLGVEQALLDFLSLSRATEIHGSFYSSFSEEAAHYGGIGLKVLKLDDKW